MNASRRPVTFPPPISEPGRLQMLPPLVISAEICDETLTQTDLLQFADHLAKEFEGDGVRAAWEPASWYREQVGVELCSEEHADRLRELTIERCRALTRMRTSAEELSTYREPTAIDGLVNGLSLLVILLFVFVVFPLMVRSRCTAPAAAVVSSTR